MTQFPVLYIDPPWEYKVWSEKGEGRTARSHYTLLDNAELLELPIHRLAAERCVLFLWATWPTLPVAMRCIEAWGFEYRTGGFDWTKTYPDGSLFLGMGYYTRANTEPCLLAVRGKNPPRRSRDVPMALLSPNTKHSQKPEEVARRIERLFDGPYCEVFARRQRPGWTCLGNEIDGRDIRDVLAHWPNDAPVVERPARLLTLPMSFEEEAV